MFKTERELVIKPKQFHLEHQRFLILYYKRLIPCMYVILYLTVAHTLLWVGGSNIITSQLVGNKDY